ncbi:MAG TPA: Mur ligase family protein [Candidatus Limnocylindrales bacterium]|nr:Mur ligase family protein [Candidatus Limnocylindrales bacterium]
MPADALTRIRARGPIGIRLGLERMRTLLAQLGDPQRTLRGALIAGTNGKGSVAAMVASMLGAAGLSTTQSPSPHLSSYRERITVDGRPIGAADLDEMLEEVLRASEPGEAEHGPATEFELLTAAAYLWSARRHVDVVVMEVGLGGRLDATNTWAADVAAITTVGLDHQEFLGDTVESVAAEKAAIIKPGCRAVTGATGAALEVIEARAREMQAPLTICPPLPVEGMDVAGMTLHAPRLGRIRIPLSGRHQARNAAVALGVVAALGDAGVAEVPDAAIVRGLATTRWPGRLELVAYAGRTVLLDGAHNPDGAAALAEAVDELAPLLPRGRAVLLLAMMSDKAVTDVLLALAGSGVLRQARCVTTRVPDSERSLSVHDLAAAWAVALGRPVDAAIDDADAALEHALELAAASGGTLVVTGSLYLVGHARGRLLPDPEVS